MYKQLRSRRKIRSHLVGAVLSILLTGCFNHIMMERDAPELRRQYVLTENLVLTEARTYLPKFGQPLRLAPFAMTQPYFTIFESDPNPWRGEGELTDQGTIKRGSRVNVKRMFLSMSSAANIRTAELQFANQKTEEQLTVYAIWDDVSPKLKEVP